jgi:thiol-disulfide isomerase/thioredoxin
VVVTETLKNAWRALRRNYWGALAMDIFLLVLAFTLVSMWQTRGLPDAEHTPQLELMWLDDMQAETIMVPGEVGVVYFFAPWCFYCKHSIDNLDKLVADGSLAWARTVALDYASLDEVREFIQTTGVSLPVLLGGPKTSMDWNVRAFPTYFVIDEKGQIASRSVGYSTKIGLQSRVWLNRK